VRGSNNGRSSQGTDPDKVILENKTTTVRPGFHRGKDDVYKMKAKPRGMALIINNERFDPIAEVELETRHGSEEDVCQLQTLFGDLGFDVQTKRNLTRKQLLDELASVACKDHSKYDCFVLWIMSHGTTGRVYCSDGNTVPIETVRDMLSNTACKTLSGKPKLCFIQACRGEREDKVVVLQSPVPARQKSDSPVNRNEPSISLAPRIPEHSDFLTAYSTVEGYVAYRNENFGSLYVLALVNVFLKRVPAHDHILDILTKVTNNVSTMQEIVCNKGTSAVESFVQVPEFTSTLTKKLKF